MEQRVHSNQLIGIVMSSNSEEIRVSSDDVMKSIDVILRSYVSHKRNPVGIRRIFEHGFSLGHPDLGIISLAEDPLGSCYRSYLHITGQALFDKLKEECDDPSESATKYASYRIVDAACLIAEMDKENMDLRELILDHAFDGVGDDNWRWSA